MTDKIAGYAFEVCQPDGSWAVTIPQLFKTQKGAENSAKRYVGDCSAEGWESKARVIQVPAQ